MSVRAIGVGGIVVLLCWMLAACSPPLEEDAAADASAVLRIRAGDAEVESADGVAQAVDGQELTRGDIVTATGDGAIIELDWSDGSVTRLGPDTVFTVGAPGDPLGTRGVQAQGITWNRVAEGAAEDAADSDASAAEVPYLIDLMEGDRAGDRGSLFVIDCQTTPCRVIGTGGGGADGSKTSFRRGGVTTEIVAGDPAGWSELMSDEWAESNAALDVDAGFAPVADLFADADPSRALVDGTFSALRTQTKWDCSGPGCATLFPTALGEQRTLRFRFHTECTEGGGACSTMVDTQSVNTATNEIIDATAPLITGASSFAWGTDDTSAVCFWTYENGLQEETGLSRNVVRWEVTPTHAEVIDGVYLVTELTGGSQASLKVVEHTSPAFPGCETFEHEFDAGADLVLTRVEEG